MVMNLNLKNRLGAAMNSLYLVCLVGFAVAIAHHHTQLVFSEYPLDYNEGGMLVTTDTISRGGNPFSLENQPARISLYPVLFSVIVAPVSRIFGNTLELHRMLVGLFVLASCALCYYLCRSNSGSRTESFTAAALCYAALLYYSTPVAGPNGLGLFFFFLAITIPWMYEFSTRSLMLAIVLGILAFYSKQYFVASLGYIALYMFLAVSKLRAVYFGLAALATFIVVLAFVSYTSPYYLADTFFAVFQSSAILASSDAFLVSQSKEFLQHNLPVLVILVLAILYRWRSKAVLGFPLEQNSQSEGFVNLFDLDKPLLQRKPNYIWVCCACSVIIVALSLGKNQGNHLTYFLQLISPFLLVGTFALSSNIPNWRWPFRILALWAMYNSYSLLQTDFSVNEDSWRIVKKEIAQANDIYASTLVLQEIMAKGAPVYESGATRYFIFGASTLPYLKTDPDHTTLEIWERYVQLIQGKIKNREFDLLLIDNWMRLPKSLRDTEVDTQTLLRQNYRKTAIVLSLPQRPGGGDYNVQIWKPIPAKPGEEK